MTTLAIYTGVAIDSSGNAVSGADVEVRLESSGALASIWSDEAGTIAIANPATALTDSNGRFSFYAAGADRGYSVKVTKAADTYTLHNQAVGTAGQLDQSAILLQSTFGATGDVIRATGAGASAKAGTGFSMWNGTIVPSQNGTVLTLAVKTTSGGDPSATDPVYVAFRDVTSKNGSVSIIKLTAATSISTTVGGTFGVANSVAFRLWVVGFNDGGTFRLAIINCLTTAAGAGVGRDVTKIFSLAQFGIASATQIGAGSTAAQTFYSFGAAVTSKPYTTLCYLTYETVPGLATAGTFNVDQSTLEPFRPGVPLPGTPIQKQRTDTGAVVTGTTLIPDDDTIPQSTEGDQAFTLAITPTSAANALDIKAGVAELACSAASNALTVALFQDATANALAAAQSIGENVVGVAGPFTINKTILASTTSATTFKIRTGAGGAGTTTVNGRASARKLGGVLNSYLEVMELMA